MKKKFHISLLGWVAIAIASGIVLGQVMPAGMVRLFVTFNGLFGNFLSFSIPLIILGLVAPAIGEIGKGAGRLLLVTALIAYGSTIFSGFFTYFSASAVFPMLLAPDTQLTVMDNPENLMLTPYFIVAMPPLIRHRVGADRDVGRCAAPRLHQLPRHHCAPHRIGHCPAASAPYLRYFSEYYGERTGDRYHDHVSESDSCHFCAPYPFASGAVCDCGMDWPS